MKKLKNFDKYLIMDTIFLGGILKRYRFENNYGASIIRNKQSRGHEKGLFELAVLKFDKNNNPCICYNTPLTNNVIGYLNWEEVIEYLEKIQNL